MPAGPYRAGKSGSWGQWKTAGYAPGGGGIQRSTLAGADQHNIEVTHTPSGYAPSYEHNDFARTNEGPRMYHSRYTPNTSTFRTEHRAKLAAEALANRVQVGRGGSSNYRSQSYSQRGEF